MLKMKAQITDGNRIESPRERTQVRVGFEVRSALLIQSGSASDTLSLSKKTLT